MCAQGRAGKSTPLKHGCRGKERLSYLSTYLHYIVFLPLSQRRSTYTSRGTLGNFGEIRGGVGKSACWRTKVAISLKRVTVKTEEKLLWMAYRNSPMLFRTVNGTIPDPIWPSLLKIGLPPINSGIVKATDFQVWQGTFIECIQKLCITS